MDEIDVIKYDLNFTEQWRYSGRVLSRAENYLILEAFFDRSDVLVANLMLSRGDRFLEIYFKDRWYNIFEVYSGESDLPKGWYCNITRPALIQPGNIRYVDLALDLVVLPDGQQTVLDEDEFEQLLLDDIDELQALAALNELQALFAFHLPEFSIDRLVV